MGRDQKLVYSAAIFYTTITGLSFLFVKVALASSNPIDILAYRFSAAFVAILLYLLVKKSEINYNFSKLKKTLPLTIFHPLMCFAFQTFGLIYASSSEG